MSIGQGGDDIFGADLLLKVGVDASGAAAEVTSKLTAAERAAVASGDRIAAGYASGAEKATVAQLRVVAATERLNKTLQNEKATLGQRAQAQAALISAQQRYTTEVNRTSVAEQTAARKRLALAEKEAVANKGRFGGFLRQSVAAGVGIGGAQLLVSQLAQAKAAAVDYQDVVSANQVTFGQQRKQIDDFKRTQADALNISKLQAESLANTFGSIFKTAGASPQDAVAQGLELTKRAADVRSFRGGQLKDVADAFRSALVGETEPIRRYGVLLDDSRLRLRALDLGLVKSTKETLPPAIKAQAAYAEILAQTTDAQGDVSRTADQATNKIEDQRQKAADARLELGQGLLPVISELAQAGSELAPALAGVARGLAAVLSNDLARRAIYLGVAAAGVVKLTSALQDFGAKTAGKISANLGLARSYDVLAGSAGRAAIAEGAALNGGGAGVAGRGRRGQLGLLGPLLAGAGLTGSVGAATGSGALNDASTIGGATLTGAGIGSFFPGAGTAIGAGVGALLGLGAVAFGGDGTTRTTNRTPAQIRAEQARVNDQLAALRQQAPSAAGNARAVTLQSRQGDLAKELTAAKQAATQTTQVLDPLTGKFKSMTRAQIEAANAATLHSAALKKERDAFDSLVDSFRVDPFAEIAKPKSLSPEGALSRIRGNVADARDTRRDYRTLARRGASREQLDAIRTLEAANPGTLDRIAAKDGKGYTNALDRELRKLGREAKLTARIFDEADTLAAERKGRKDAQAYYDSYAGYFASLPGGTVPGISALPAGPSAPARAGARYDVNKARQITRRAG